MTLRENWRVQGIHPLRQHGKGDVVLEQTPVTAVSWMYRKRKQLSWCSLSRDVVPSDLRRLHHLIDPWHQWVCSTLCTLRNQSNTDVYKIPKAHLIYMTCTDIYFLSRQLIITTIYKSTKITRHKTTNNYNQLRINDITHMFGVRKINKRNTMKRVKCLKYPFRVFLIKNAKKIACWNTSIQAEEIT